MTATIPAPLATLIGRTSELDAITKVLRRARLVTLTGPGGVGKTRTAVELGRRQAHLRGDGVWLVDLSSVTADDDVAAETARVLDVPPAAGSATSDRVRRYLADRDVLLVLDNCEHLLVACTMLVTTLLGACPNLRILATSREPLAVPGEVVWKLEPLLSDDSYRLFLARARERRPDFVPDADGEAAIVEICARLDNLPLGIELAAARVNAMSPQEIAASLEARFGDLGGPQRSAPPHHRSIRAVVDWSYRLLDPDEQVAFRSLAVFVGSFDSGAACAVAAGMSLDVLVRLVDKSLVTVVPAGPGRTRYRLLETVRDFASDQLTAPELTAARRRHLAYYSTTGIPADEGWMSPRALVWLEERAADYGNVRAAVEWAAASEPCAAMRLLAETKDLFFMLGQADGRRLAELVLQRCPERNRHRVEVEIAASHFAFQLGDGAAAAEHSAEAIELSLELGDRVLEGSAQWFLGLQQMLAGASDKARGLLTSARAIQQEVGDRLGEARTTAALGLTCLMDGDSAAARDLLDSALAIARETQDAWSEGQASLYRGILATSSSDWQAASSFFRKAVECLRPLRDSTLFPVALVGQASVMAQRDPGSSLKLLAAAWAIRAQNGGEFAPFYRAFAEKARTAATMRVGGDADRLWREGSELSVDDAVALAFGGARPRPPRALPVSDRELDVVRLVADGLSNREIASKLHLSLRTIETHVRHALAKTGATNRTQLAMWARQRDV